MHDVLRELHDRFGDDLDSLYGAFDLAEEGTMPEEDTPVEHGETLLAALSQASVRLLDRQGQAVTDAASAVLALKHYSDGKDLGRDGLVAVRVAGFDMVPAA